MRRRAEFRVDGLTADKVREWRRHGPTAPRAGLLVGTLATLAILYAYSQTGASLEVVPRVDFGDQPLHAATHTETIHVANRGASRLHISELTLEGFHLDDFVVSANTCADSVVESEGECLVQVRFMPKGEGPRSAQLVITDNARDSPQRVTLSGVGVEPPAPVARTEITPAPVDFGSEEVRRAAPTRTVRVTNVGTGPLDVHRIAVSAADAREFSVPGETCTGTPIPPNRGCTIQVQFTPQGPGPRTAQLVIAHNAADSLQTVVLRGRGTVAGGPLPAPSIEISPNLVDFGPWALGRTGTRQTVRLRNPGTAPLNVTSVTISGVGERDFAVVEQRCTQAPVAPGGSCTVVVEFTPRARALRSAELLLSDNAVGSPHPVALRGVGEERPVLAPERRVEIAPTTIDFGSRAVGRSGPTRTVQMSNVGTGPLEVRSVRPNAVEAGEFAVRSENCTRGPLAPQTSCAVVVEFTPRARGVRSGKLVLADNAAGNPHEVGLNGIGTEAPRPDPMPRVEITPSPLDFGQRDVGRPGPGQRVRMGNVGTGPLVVRSVRASGGEAQDFAVMSETCTERPVASGAGCTVVVEFTPRGIGVRSAELLFADNAEGSSHHVGLRGVGEKGRGPAPVPLVEITPNPVGFGRPEVGRSVVRQTVRLSNAGSGPLLVRSMRLGGGEAREFDVQSETCTHGAIAPGAACTIAVEFTPRARGVRAAELLLATNAAGSPHLVVLRGVGEERPGPTLAPSVDITPDPVDFGRPATGLPANQQSVRIRNSGTGPLQVTGVAITGADERDFVVATQTCSRGAVAPSMGCMIFVEFSPKAAGSRAAQLVITDNAVGSPHRVRLSGTGRDAPPAPGVKIAPRALNLGSAVVGRPGMQGNIELMSVGTGALEIARITLGGANAEDFRVAQETCAARPVKPDTSCNIFVVFNPHGAGRREGFLTIRDNASGSPHRVDLSGEGVVPSIPRVLDTPRRAVDTSRFDPMGWCCTGGTVQSSSRRACMLKNGAFQPTEDVARRQCPAVIR